MNKCFYAFFIHRPNKLKQAADFSYLFQHTLPTVQIAGEQRFRKRVIESKVAVRAIALNHLNQVSFDSFGIKNAYLTSVNKVYVVQLRIVIARSPLGRRGDLP